MKGYGDLIREARMAVRPKLSQEALLQRIRHAFPADAKPTHSTISRMETEAGDSLPTPEVFNALIEELPTLQPYLLLKAMGYNIAIPSQERAVPPELVELCLQMDEQTKFALVESAHGQLLRQRELEARRRRSSRHAGP